MPQFAQTFVGPQYKIIKTVPYEANKYAGFNYFAALVISTMVGILFALNFGG